MSNDFHTHSTFSDGLLDPEELISLAVERGIKTISVTDHDSVSNYQPVLSACKKNKIELLKGSEISSMNKGRDVHILAYFENEDDYLKLSDLENKRKKARLERLKNICKNLTEIGILIKPEEVSERLPPGTNVGRPHIARLLIEKGYADTQDEVFNKFLAEETPGYVPTTHDPTSEMIRLIIDLKGLPVLAHPGNFFFRNEEDLLSLIRAGLMGIECYCPSNNTEKVNFYLGIVKKYHLVATGGSDFHGFYPDRQDNFGWIMIPKEENENFRERLKQCASA